MCIVIFFGSYIVSNSQCGQSHCGLEFEFLCFYNILSKLFKISLSCSGTVQIHKAGFGPIVQQITL